MRYLRAKMLAEASAAFGRWLVLDAKHVSSIMEIEYLKLREEADPAHLAEIFRVTISGGAAWYRAGDDPQTLVARANQLLVAAKQNGRNQICAEGA